MPPPSAEPAVAVAAKRAPDEILRSIRHVALDLDGTLYRGGTLFDFSIPFLALLEELEIGVSFLTNNSSKSVDEYLASLARLGVRVRRDQMITSTVATIDYLRAEQPAVRRLFVLGTASMRREITAAGFAVTEDRPDDEPDAVLVGFDTALTYERLCRAAYWIARNKPFVASHPDRVCPTDDPTVLVDCGALCSALSAATGRRPVAIPGKPDPRMLQAVLHRHGLEASELAMVGDRLYTDVAMAQRTGAVAVLVLTGEATRSEAAQFVMPPFLVLENLAEFGQRLLAAKRAVHLGAQP